MKTILITGAYGQLGDACAKHLKNDFKLILSGITPANNGVNLDITSKNSIEKVLKSADSKKLRASMYSLEALHPTCKKCQSRLIEQ